MRTVALAIPHCSWDPERVRTLRRLRSQLEMSDFDVIGSVTEDSGWSVLNVFAEPGPSHCSVWSNKMWTWGEETGADDFLTIQDDAIVIPHFWNHFRAMCEALPDEIIGLQAIHPAGPDLARNGCRWYTTRDMLAGVAYRIPRPLLVAFNKWRREQVRPGTEMRINEDNLVALFAVTHGLKIYHPIPTIADHHAPEEQIRSNYGHATHGNRNSTVTWRQVEPVASAEWWKPRPAMPPNIEIRDLSEWTPHLGRFYLHTTWHLARNIEGWTEEEMRALESDLVRIEAVREAPVPYPQPGSQP